MKRVILVAVGGLLVVGVVLAVSRPGGAAQKCHQIVPAARIQSTVIQPGEGPCPSTAIACTAGEFSNDPLLRGTTLSVADGVAPSAGMPAVVQPETISFHTIYTITTERGTISFDNTGVFNPDVSIFAEFYVVIGGTGIFEGAAGFMMDMGRGTTGFGTTDVIGEICLQN